MDPVTVVVAALMAGVVAGAGETASQAVKDGYVALKGLIRRTFAGDQKAESVLTEFEADPETYEKPLAKQLERVGSAQDGEVITAAEAVLKAADAAGIQTKYQITVSGGKVGIIGDHGTVTMN
ncbi:hypothetical protein [Granulicoccus sp. GXG6511]|uniref:hypothetical protein n=1 Tax=Granulicoccus sp. GXG6511 TaxID=3381351 RepID=UPI003D7C6CE9